MVITAGQIHNTITTITVMATDMVVEEGVVIGAVDTHGIIMVDTRTIRALMDRVITHITKVNTIMEIQQLVHQILVHLVPGMGTIANIRLLLDGLNLGVTNLQHSPNHKHTHIHSHQFKHHLWHHLIHINQLPRMHLENSAPSQPRSLQC